MRVAGLLLAIVSLAGCSAGPAAATGPLDPSAFLEVRSRIREVRAQAGSVRTENVSLKLEAPYMPGALTARGAVAVKPPDGLRMILVGPGGTTAMDLWSVGGRYRFDIPPLGRTLRGDAATPVAERRGLPVDFLRWWMLDPLGGRLLAARRRGSAIEFALEKDGRTTEGRLDRDGSLTAHRLWWGTDAGGAARLLDEEWLEADGAGCSTVVYRQRSTALTVEASCESRRDGANEAAFVEPGSSGEAS